MINSPQRLHPLRGIFAAFSVSYIVVARGAAGIQGQEGIAILQAPDDNPFYSIDAVAFHIVLQYNCNLLLAYAVNHIAVHPRSCLGAAGIIAVHIPIKIPETQLCQALG